MFPPNFQKEFIGRDALLKQRDEVMRDLLGKK